ncbi:hypothetical protein PC120_g20681 [Phytophthora cactorum]|nr:hypothetical protein PC120_g20681 [Phytophthora cactorum]
MDAPSVLLLDIFDTHVSEKDIGVVTKKTSALVCWLPANSTAVSQPSDVGVMKHLKKKSTALWVAETRKSTKVTADVGRSTATTEKCAPWGLVGVEECACVINERVELHQNNATSTEATEEERKKAAAKRKKQNQVIVRAND